MTIAQSYKRIRQEVPDNVTIVLAAKTRTAQEIEQAIDAGATDIGENYVQEAGKIYSDLGKKAQKVNWHMIGHLQKNKINKALKVFDVIQTIDSLENATEINNRAEKAGRHIVPVYIEINIGSEDSKAGIKPQDHEPFEQYMEQLVCQMAELCHLRIEGLMTMGPRSADPEKSRPYFRRTRKIFENLERLELPNVQMQHLSMGMSSSYKVAIEEGSNMVRLGTALFGKREYDEASDRQAEKSKSDNEEKLLI
jgi:pyridoxal phosphate enzyme (YggS family)